MDIIGEEAFGSCSALKKVSLPTTIRILEPNIFSGCDKLTEVSFRGTLKNWNSIKKGFWDYDSHIRTIHCSDGDAPSEQSSRPIIQY